jgi:enamine deaminase RidA (YjgF/YER057c/UK114 family)
MATIQRIGPSRLSPTRSRAVLVNGLMMTVAVSSSKTPSLYEQTKDALRVLEGNLAEAGADSSGILLVMAYISRIEAKDEFNRAWDEWVDPGHLPLRACVGAKLEGDDLVELVVTASI